MAALEITVTIDDQAYSQRQLEAIQRERGIHVLHEMKRLGAVLKDGENVFSHDDINYLSAEDVKRISVATCASLGWDGVKSLFRDQIQRSLHMWEQIVSDGAEGEPAKLSIALLHVTGLVLEDYQKLSQRVMMESGKGTLEFLLHPEHFALSPTTEGLHGMETMGMYGGPTEMWVVPDPQIETPLPRDPEFPVAMVGYSRIGRDATSTRNTSVMHQFKPLEHGILMKTCVFFPAKTPQDVVDGHKLHVAIEFSEGVKAAYQSKHRRVQ